MGRDTSKKSQRDKRIQDARAVGNARVEEAHERLIERLARMPRGERVEYIRQHSYDGPEFGRLLHEANAQAEHNRLQAAAQEEANLTMARLRRGQRMEREWREAQDRPPQEDDPDPEANLDAILEKARRFEATHAPTFYEDAPPEPDYEPQEKREAARQDFEAELEAYGSRLDDPLKAQRAQVESRSATQAAREEWAKPFVVKQEAERAAREARSAARRAEQEAKRGVMKRARQQLVRVLTRALDQAGEVDARLLKDVLPSVEE